MEITHKGKKYVLKHVTASIYKEVKDENVRLRKLLEHHEKDSFDQECLIKALQFKCRELQKMENE